MKLFFFNESWFYSFVWIVNALSIVFSEMLKLSRNNKNIKMFGVPPNTLPLVIYIGIFCYWVLLHYNISFKTIAGGFNGAFWWYGPLSEDWEFLKTNLPKLSCGFKDNILCNVVEVIILKTHTHIPPPKKKKERKKKKKNIKMEKTALDFTEFCVFVQRLTKLQGHGTELVTNVRVAADSREAQRRAEEEEAQRQRYGNSLKHLRLQLHYLVHFSPNLLMLIIVLWIQ